MKIVVFGSTGRMGRIVCSLLEDGFGGGSLACGVSPSSKVKKLSDYAGSADCVVDFSGHAATNELLAYCIGRKLPVVIATTGHTEGERLAIKKAAEKIPVFFSYNMSVGVALLARLAKQTAAMFPDADIEIIERHHNQKKDVPSGTALLLADSIREARPQAVYNIGRHENGKRTKGEIGIHSLRYGNEVGTHEIIVSTGSQTITLKHEAENRALFAEGALTAAEFICGREPGLYTMQDLILF